MLLRHGLGVIGVAAAGVLLAVSAAMNWQFGFNLGRTPLDGQIYGAASAAADCMKALLPFFFFAAWRNRMWSQAAAAVLVWVVVTAYSLTSALGHAALNRMDSTGQRAVAATSHKDLRADVDRAREQMSWVPSHRPAATVAAEIEGMKLQRAHVWTNGCTVVTGKQGRDFCQKLSALDVELAAAKEAVRLEARIQELGAKLQSSGGVVMAAADPQAQVLTALAGALGFAVRLEDIQTALTVFVALLLEVGSGFGMYVAFSQWRIHERREELPVTAPVATTQSARVAASQAAVPTPLVIEPPKAIANDNKSIAMDPAQQPEESNAQSADTRPPIRNVAPETDVARFRRDRIDIAEGASVTATALYEEYCAWCEEREKEPLALPTFGREFGDLGIQKAKIAGRVRYIGIKLMAGSMPEDDTRRGGVISGSGGGALGSRAA